MMRILTLLPVLLWLVSANPARAAADDSLVYVVKRGDTLIDLGRKYFLSDTSYRIVQKANNIRDVRSIAVGTKLRITRSVLKYKASTARIVSVRGNVTLSFNGAANTPATGTTLGEGSTLKTAASSFATLALENGSRVSLPSNSDLRIVRLRRYLIDSSLDYDFEVGRGGAKSKVTPLTNRNDRYVVKTPKAVSAVRGTDFQARYDEASGSDFSEVTEGALALDLPGGAKSDMPAGNGLAVTAQGSVIREALLAPLDLEGAGKMQKDKTVRFAIPATPGMSAVRVTLAADAGFIEQVADGNFAGDSASFDAIDDGNYFVRVRAISPAGIEGMPVTYAFKRRLNSVSASGGKSDLGFAFKWLVEGRGTLRYHFQLFRDRPDGTAMVDEAGLTNSEISLSDLPAGDYYWRVASVQYLDGEVSTSWTPFEKLSVSAP